MQEKFSYPTSVKILLCFVMLLFSMPAEAQRPYIPFKHFSTGEGLSQNQVLAILEDHQGFMWFGTLEGLNRFDGYEFTTYFHDKKDSTSISHNSSASLIEDRQGVLWIGTAGGLSRYNKATNTFTSYVHDPSNQNSISIGLINEMAEDKLGNFWLAFATGYVDYFDRTKNTFLHFQIDKNRADVTALKIDDKGNLWIGSKTGITVLNSSHGVSKRYAHDGNDNKTLSNNLVKDIFQDDEGNIWVATDDGLNLYDAQHDGFVRFFHSEHNPNTLIINTLKCLSQDNQGRLWIGTENGGLDIWDRKKNAWHHFQKHELDVRGISDNSIYYIFRDQRNNMWVGTNKSGFNFYDQLRKPFVIYQNVPDQKTTISDNRINAIAEQPGKGFWIATDGGGLNFFDEEKNVFKSYRYQSNNPSSLPSDFLVDVLWDPQEACVWVATWGGGLARLDPNSGRFIRYQHRDQDEFSIASNNLWRLYLDKEGILYVGSVGNGFSIYDKKNSKFYNYNPENGLAEENAVSIFRDSKDFLWIGSWGSGLSRMDLFTRSFVSLPKGITINSNGFITEDSLHRVWISGSPGIQCYDLLNDSVFSITTEEGLPETNINGMSDDQHGNFWLATNKGIVKYSVSNRQANIFSLGDGLPSTQFSPEILRTAKGKMYFGSSDGLVVFHPDSIRLNPEVPRVVITDLKIFNKSVFAGGEDGILKDHISETKEIWLPFEYNFISLSFVALSYTSPQGNQYAYRLKEFDKDWISIEGQRSATYTSLDPGDYTFIVKASNNDGLWNEEGASLIIHVMPPWWETIWFKILVAVFVGSSAVTFYRLRIRSIANQNKRLSALVKERTRELNEMNEAVTSQNETLQERQEEIETQNEELKQSQEEVLAQRDVVFAQNQKLEEARSVIEKQNEETKLRNENLELEVQSRTKELVAYNQQLEQFAFISAHNLRAPVARILGLGNILDLEPKFSEDNKMIYQKMVTTAKELDRVVRDLNTILEIRKNNELISSKVSFEEELALVKQYIEKEIEDTRCTLAADFSKAPIVKSVKPYVESVMQNLLSNAIKYRHPNRTPVIQMSTEHIDGYICLTVSDNGLGIDTELYKNKIFTLYQRFHNHVEGKGLGLYLVKTQIIALGGKIELESKLDEGTVFKVYFKN